MVEVVTKEPLELSAGDRWQWLREDLQDYPAGAWTLHYYFKSGTDAFDFAAVADGTDFSVDQSPAQTSGFVAGQYEWTAYVVKTGDRQKVASGRLTVLADLANATVIDSRSHAVKVLAAIEAVIEGRASKDQESYSINGRSLSRTSLTDLLEFRRTYRAEVQLEQQQSDMAAGRGNSSITKVRFTR